MEIPVNNYPAEIVELAVIGGLPPKEAMAKAAVRADQRLKRAQKA